MNPLAQSKGINRMDNRIYFTKNKLRKSKIKRINEKHELETIEEFH